MKHVHCHGSGVLGRDPRDSCRFWSPHVENVCTVTQIRLGESGGGGRRTEGMMCPLAPPPPPPLPLPAPPALPPPSPPPNGSPTPFLWCGVVWCAVVVASFGVVGSAGGSACCGSHPPPLWHGVGSGCLVVVTPCVFGSALCVWYTHPYDDDNDDGMMMITNLHH